MHIVTRLMAQGYRVSVLDLDGHQRTLASYLDNRALYAQRHKLALEMPHYTALTEQPSSTLKATRSHSYGMLVQALEQAISQSDCVVIDCPGADTFLGRLGHLVADTLVTPLNDSFVDLDVLARCDPETAAIVSPSAYSEMVWGARKRRFLLDGHRLDWVVVRNRVSHLTSRNARAMAAQLGKLRPLLGFREAQGFGDRVIFRELFLRGLTLSDLRRHKTGVTMTMNHVAAHQEIKALVGALRLSKPTHAPKAALA